MGKGRTIAGIIFENWLQGRKKALWVSVSSDLKYDSERDLSDIGAKIPVMPLNKVRFNFFLYIFTSNSLTSSSFYADFSTLGKVFNFYNKIFKLALKNPFYGF